MEAYAAGFNAFNQLGVDPAPGQDDEPDDVVYFTRAFGNDTSITGVESFLTFVIRECTSRTVFFFLAAQCDNVSTGPLTLPYQGHTPDSCCPEVSGIQEEDSWPTSNWRYTKAMNGLGVGM